MIIQCIHLDTLFLCSQLPKILTVKNADFNTSGREVLMAFRQTAINPDISDHKSN